MRNDATAISPLIAVNGGAATGYEFVDVTALAGERYVYWLVEHTADGTQRDAARTQLGFTQTFLPSIGIKFQ